MAGFIKAIKKYVIDIIFCVLIVISIKYLFPLATGIDINQANTFDPILKPLQSFFLGDFYFSRIMNYNSIQKDTNIILVNIGEPDRKNIANQLKIISRYEPRVVALDVIFRNMKDSATDVILTESMAQIPNLVLASEIHIEENDGTKRFVHSESENAFSKNGISAHVGLIKRIDNKAAGFVPVDYSFKYPVYSLPVKIVQLFDSSKAQKIIARNNPSELINFKRNIDKYTVFDINGLQEGKNLDRLRDKIVILGFLGQGLDINSSGDRIHTPLNKVYIGNGIPDMYGVVVIANIVSMILEEDYINTNIYYPEYLQYIFGILAIALLITLLLYLTLKFPAKAAFARFAAINIIIVISLTAGLILLAVFDYMLYMHGFIIGLVMTFAVFEAYAFLFRKRLDNNE